MAASGGRTRHRWAHWLALGLLALEGAVTMATAQATPQPLDVGHEKQLLVDDAFFARQEGIALRVHPPRKTGELNLTRERPWEGATLNWFSVLREGDRYRMWYECYDVAGWPTADDTSFCYAESLDGIHWKRPNLGLCPYAGDPATNILFRLIGPPGAHSRVHGVQVCRDPRAPAAERYKAVSQGLFAGMDPPHRVAGMVSPDGLHWTRYADPICPIFADSQYSGFWDASRGKYVLYGRVGGRGRAIGCSESEEFAHFPPLELVMQTDDQDPPDSDLYNPAALRYPYAASVYLAFPSLYQHGPDTLDIRLAVSRDGIHWTWPERVPFIPLGPADAFDSGSLYMGQGLVRHGDELWQYYSGSVLKHQESELENLVRDPVGRAFSRVVSRLDGFVSAAAGPDGGWFVTPPLRFDGTRLGLNVRVEGGGVLRVALLDEAQRPLLGFALTDCDPVTGDHVSQTISWRGKTGLAAFAATPIRLCIEMRAASLYAFQFRR